MILIIICLYLLIFFYTKTFNNYNLVFELLLTFFKDISLPPPSLLIVILKKTV